MTLPDFPEPSSSARTDNAAARPAPGFEPTLVPRVRAAHAMLKQRFADLIPAVDRDPAASLRAIEESSRQFGAVRHIETVWLYPPLASVLDGDAGGRAQLMELRLVSLMLARRTLRCFDDLLQAARAEVLISDSAARVSVALANYSAHCERAIYPLYELIGTQEQDVTRVA